MPKRPTLADVAERAGVSKTAVSLILNDRQGSRLSADAAARVRTAARELSYRPNAAARGLRLGKTRTVGFISNDVTITRYASAMIRGALDVAGHHDHTVLIAETGSSLDQMENALDAMVDRRADGLVFASMTAKEIDVPELTEDIPVVLLNSTSARDHATVLPAEDDAGYAIARLLLDRGHRRIGLIGNAPEAIDNPRVSATIGSRLAGIRRALGEAEVGLVVTIDESDWEPARGFEGAQAILDGGSSITALICLNDRLAFGAYQAIQERGLRIPQDISVASFDDDEIAAYLRPGLTTARIPYEEMGRQAMEMLLTEAPPTGRRLVPMPVQRRASIRRIRQ